MQKATAWQPHSVRAFLSGLRIKGSVLSKEQRKSGETIHRLTGKLARQPMPKLGQKIEALGRMSPAELRCVWRETFKQAAPSISPDLMGRAIAYRWQERQHGGLPASVTRDIVRLTRVLVRTGTLEETNELSLKPGTRLVRDWNGPTLDVLVCEEGFELDWRQFGSLTQIARDVTGTRWSGPRFFGLKKRKTPPMRRAPVDA